MKAGLRNRVPVGGIETYEGLVEEMFYLYLYIFICVCVCVCVCSVKFFAIFNINKTFFLWSKTP